MTGMSWNCRIMRHRVKVRGKNVVWYAMHEVFYNKDKKVCAYTHEPARAIGDNVNDLIGYLETLLKDAKRSRKAVLNFQMKVAPADWDNAKCKK